MAADLDRASQGALDTLLAALEQARPTNVGFPGAVDFDKSRNDPKAADMYNKTLAALRDIGREVAQ